MLGESRASVCNQLTGINMWIGRAFKPGGDTLPAPIHLLAEPSIGRRHHYLEDAGLRYSP